MNIMKKGKMNGTRWTMLCNLGGECHHVHKLLLGTIACCCYLLVALLLIYLACLQAFARRRASLR